MNCIFCQIKRVSLIIILLISIQNIRAATCAISVGASYSYPVCTAANGSIQIAPTGGSTPYHYRWSGGDTVAAISRLAVSSYTVTVTDAAHCTAMRTFSLTASSRVITPVLNGYADTCAGSRGKISVALGGNGNAPFRYAWSNGRSGTPLTGLTAGIYAVTVTDSNGCTATTSAELTNIGTPIMANGIVSSPLCPGGRGSITVAPSGGTSTTYNMVWSTGANTTTISNLTSGNYTVTVSGTNGCSSSTTYTMAAAPTSISVNATVTQPQCSNGKGNISISPTGGTGPLYTAVWNNGQTGLRDTSLTVGTYSVIVSDQNSCLTSGSFTITALTAIVPAGSITNPICTSSNGFIQMSPTGGRSPYSYLWSTGSSTQTISGLAAGSYSVTVTDLNGCTAASTFSPSVYMRPLTLSVSTIADTCSSSHGRATVSVSSSGNALPYTYSWAAGMNTQTISNILNGSYVVSVTDANGCQNNITAIVANATENININPYVFSPICTSHNGYIQLTPAGGRAPYSYTWTGGSTASRLGDLVAGSYTATVTDYYGCSVSQSVPVYTYMRPMAVSASSSADTCAMGRGKTSVTVTTPTSTAPFTYAWSSGATTSSVTGLGAHYYTVTVTDSCGCYATTGTSVVNIGSAISIAGTVTQPICSTDPGAISIAISGGTSSQYATTWSNGSSGNSLTGLSGGNYTVTVNGTNACSATRSYSINTIAPLVANVLYTDVKCDSGTGGTILLSGVSGGTYPWTISWIGPNSFTSNSVSLYHLSAGTYAMSLTDAHGCVASGSYTLYQKEMFRVIPSITNASCLGGHNGAISLNTINAYSSPTYSWTGPNGFTSSARSITALSQGVYTVSVTEPYGCVLTQNDTVKGGPSLVINYSTTPVHCDTPTGGTLTMSSFTGATYPWVGSWSGPNGFTSSSMNLNRLSSGTYTISVTDALGCSTTGSYHVDSIGGVTVTYAPDIITCPGSANGSITYQLLKPYSRNAVYNWTGPGSYTSTQQSVSGLAPGIYTITVSEDFGCKVSNSYNIIEGFDVGVRNIYNNFCPTPAKQVIVHPIAGDMSQINGQHCAAGVSGKVQMIYTGSAHYSGVVQGSLTPSAINGDTLTWNVADYGTLRSDSAFFVYLTIDSNAALGSQVCVAMKVTPTSGDYNPSNNSQTYCMTVIHSYDPNDKIAMPAGNIDTTVKEITYTIHFQNTGTAKATDVSIIDTLDRNFDLGSFQVLAFSHRFQIYIADNVARIDFAGINLPDSSANLAASSGWIQYKMKLRNNLPAGTRLTNTAYIYFDINPAIATPTTHNTIIHNNYSTTGIETVSPKLEVGLYPNPAHNNVLVEVSQEAIGGEIQIIDATGRLCSRYIIKDQVFTMPLQGYASGLYLVNVITKESINTIRKLIVE